MRAAEQMNEGKSPLKESNVGEDDTKISKKAEGSSE